MLVDHSPNENNPELVICLKDEQSANAITRQLITVEGRGERDNQWIHNADMRPYSVTPQDEKAVYASALYFKTRTRRLLSPDHHRPGISIHNFEIDYEYPWDTIHPHLENIVYLRAVRQS